MTQPRPSPDRPPVPASRVFLALLRRDALVAGKELPFFLLRVTLQPLLFVLVFGFLLPRWGSSSVATPPPCSRASSPSAWPFASLQSVALPMVADFGWTREIEDRLLAPVPITLVAFEKVVAGVVQGVIAALWSCCPSRG